MKKTIVIILFLLNQLSFSQNFENERARLIQYKYFEVKNLASHNSSWSQKKILKNGLVFQNEHYFEGKLRSRQNYVYDNSGNQIYEIQNYSSNDSKVNDTLNTQKFTYNSENILIQKVSNFEIVEKYSNFTKNGKPKLKELFSTTQDSLFIYPFKEIITYDSKENIIKEVKYKITYSQEINSTKKNLQIETNEYKYDEFDNIIEIIRRYQPKIEFPIMMTGGKPLYEVERFRYVYNEYGLWTKMYQIVNREEKLIKKRKFKK